ncbi:MAG: NfeD family protein [Planctomycetota bacterium]
MDVLLIAVLVIGGMLLIFAEICTPSFGLLGVSAAVCLGAAVWKCFAISSVLGFIALAVLIVGLPIYLSLLVRLLPRLPVGRRLMLRKLEGTIGTGVPEAIEYETFIGAEGVASSTLRPSGVVTIKGRRLVATAESGFIPYNTPVRVIRSTGMNLVVRRIDPPAGERGEKGTTS